MIWQWLLIAFLIVFPLGNIINRLWEKWRWEIDIPVIHIEDLIFIVICWATAYRLMS